MKLKSLFAVSAIAFASMSAQALPTPINLIQNGSFEAPGLGDGSWQIFYNNEVTNWVPGEYGIEVRNNVEGVAQEGFNFVELDTTANSWMTQTINISTPGAYLLSFWYNARPGVSAISDEISWQFGGETGVVMPSYTTTTNVGEWRQFSQTFKLGEGPATLRFDAIGTSTSYGGSMDNVSVTAVPEPESYALMLAGLGMMAGIARRRGNSNT